jgi:transposase
MTVKNYLAKKAPPVYNNRNRASILEPYYPMIKGYLEDDDYRATWIYKKLKHQGYVGSYETLKTYVREIKEQLHRIAYCRFESEPGYQAQVDFGDFQVLEADGSTSTVYAFVMVLGYSRALFVEFVERCTLETFMDCHIHAFHMLSGVPAEILYDNMKNVVTRRDSKEAEFNHEFLCFATHYGFTPRPCPPYSPWVKGKVERPMDYIRQNFWRGYTYLSLPAANTDVMDWLNQTANRRRHGTHHQPINERLEQEQKVLGELPPVPYDTSIKVFRKVYKDCQLSYNSNRYVVPHQVVGRVVTLKIKHGQIRIYHDDTLLACYQEPKSRHQLLINPEFYAQLKRDKEQSRRKYGRSKGKATRGLTTGSLIPQVEYRSPSFYDQFAGGGLWN